MNYYKRHIGDYAKKCGHLTPLEHGFYGLILDRYYDSEQAPTKAEAIRWSRARNPAETQMVSDLLAEFFTLRNDRYFQQRVEDELDAAKALAERNQRNGKLGGRPLRARKTHSVKSGMPEIRQSTNPLIHIEDQKKEQPRGARLSPDWRPSDDMLSWARAERPDLDPLRETENFCDYWIAKSGKDATKLDWDRTWKKWIRTASTPRTVVTNSGGKMTEAERAAWWEKTIAEDGRKQHGDA